MAVTADCAVIGETVDCAVTGEVVDTALTVVVAETVETAVGVEITLTVPEGASGPYSRSFIVSADASPATPATMVTAPRVPVAIHNVRAMMCSLTSVKPFGFPLCLH